MWTSPRPHLTVSLCVLKTPWMLSTIRTEAATGKCRFCSRILPLSIPLLLEENAAYVYFFLLGHLPGTYTVPLVPGARLPLGSIRGASRLSWKVNGLWPWPFEGRLLLSKRDRKKEHHAPCLWLPSRSWGQVLPWAPARSKLGCGTLCERANLKNQGKASSNCLTASQKSSLLLKHSSRLYSLVTFYFQ